MLLLCTQLGVADDDVVKVLELLHGNLSETLAGKEEKKKPRHLEGPAADPVLKEEDEVVESAEEEEDEVKEEEVWEEEEVDEQMDEITETDESQRGVCMSIRISVWAVTQYAMALLLKCHLPRTHAHTHTWVTVWHRL